MVALAIAQSGVTAALTAASPGMSKGPLGMGWLLWVSLLAIFLGLVGMVIGMSLPKYVSHRQRQVQSIEGYIPVGDIDLDERSAVTAISASLINLGDKVMDGRTSTPKTEQRLERADLPLRAGEWAVLRAISVVVGVAGGMILLRGGTLSNVAGAFLGGLLGFLLPAFFLKFVASRRAKKFENQLPDVLTLVASSLQTGFSLLQALDGVAKDADEPSAKEFSRALAETRIGADLNDSLEHLADRMDSKNLRWTGMAIDIQRQVGGNLAETLRNTAATLRDRQALGRHVKALSAEGRMSAYILIALPIGMFLYMSAVNRAYVSLLWTSPIGMGMLGGAIISLLVGVFWMNKVVKVEV
jgi:tight adherence protein B